MWFQALTWNNEVSGLAAFAASPSGCHLPPARRPAGRLEMTMTIRELYRPMERAVLSAYLRVADPRPEDLRGLDPTKPVPRRWSERKHGIAPQRSEIGSNHLILENAVARICLASIANDLPQWAVVRNGVIDRTRTPTRAKLHARSVHPVHLLTINWGDSGPGFSWPEAYHVTSLPGYDVSVVTASADSPDTHGYADRAIGWFPGSARTVDKARQVLVSYWVSQRECGQDRWEYLFDAGAFDERTADELADAVWAVEEVKE